MTTVFSPLALIRPRLRRCVVCQRMAHPSGMHPQLCTDCDANHGAIIAHIAGMAHAVEGRVTRTMDAYHAALERSDRALQGRLEAYHTARKAGSPKASLIEQQARSGRTEPLLHLIRLWLDYQDAGDSYATTMAWVQQCEALL